MRDADAWRVSRLAEVARWGSGGTPQAGNPRYYGGELPWAVIGDLNDGVVNDTRSTITGDGLANSSAKLIPAGTVLVAMYGSIGKLGLAGKEMATNQAIAFAVPNPEVDAKFLFYWLLSQRHALAAAGKGATQRNISQTLLKGWPIQHPVDPHQQRRIVEILEDHLSRLDAANGYLAAARRRTVSLRKAALKGLFSRDQQHVPLDQLVHHIEAGKSFGSANRPAEPGEWGIIKVSAMTWGEFRPEENKAVAADKVDRRYEIRSGDLLVSRANTNEYVGASVLVREVRSQLLLSDKSLRVVPRPGVDAEWLWRALQSPSARRQISALATGTKDSMRNISQKSLLRVELPHMAPDDQRTAVAVYRDIDDKTRGLAGAMYAAELRRSALRRAVLAAAFSGRLTGHRTDDEVIEELAQ